MRVIQYYKSFRTCPEDSKEMYPISTIKRDTWRMHNVLPLGFSNDHTKRTTWLLGMLRLVALQRFHKPMRTEQKSKSVVKTTSARIHNVASGMHILPKMPTLLRPWQRKKNEPLCGRRRKV